MSVFELSVSGWSAPARVVGFSAREGMSELYLVEALAHVPIESAAALDDVLAADATLSVNGKDGALAQAFRGIVATVELLRAHGGEALVRLELRPRLYRLTLERHSRVWIDVTFPDVLKELLSAGGVDAFELSLAETYPKREHICQYHETDYAFLCRWLEREGIRFWFDHEGDVETLHLSDQPLAHPRSPSEAVRYYPVPEDGGHASLGAAVHALTRAQSLGAERVALADYDYLKPTLAITAEEAVPPPGADALAEFGGNLLAAGEATRVAKVRAEERGAEAAVFEGHASSTGHRAGFAFELEEHPLQALNGAYLVTSAHHRGVDGADERHLARQLRSFARDDGHALSGSYRVTFTAVGGDTPYRPPRRAPWPRVFGLEPARVDGAATSDYAQIDEHGRYRVRILFDERTPPDGSASALIRMSQPHGGNPEGFHFPLRKQTEVLLGFVEGDPDRPLIVGVGPNPETPSPVTSANNTQNVIQTGGENRVEIEDRAGDQYVAIYSPPQKSSLHLGAHAGPYHEGHNATLRTDGNAKVHAGGDRHVTVGGEQTEDVQGLLKEDYHATQSTHVYGAWEETIDGGATQTISAGETRTVTGGVTEDITGSETRSITGDQTEQVSASVTRTIGANETRTVGASLDQVIGGNRSDTIGASFASTVAAGVEITTPGAMNVDAGGPVTFIVPGGFKLVAPGGFNSVDSFWHKAGFFHSEGFALIGRSYGFHLKLAASFVSLNKVALEYCVAKAELTGSHGGYKGKKFNGDNLDSETHGTHTEVAGAHPHA